MLQSNFTTVWEFEVPAETRAEFERQYGPNGAWQGLFRGADGFVETRLWRDPNGPGRYLTVDLWESAVAHRAFREARAAEYEALDEVCAQLTTSERHVGDFEDLSPLAPDRWRRWFAVEYNNLAWQIADDADASAESRERMLHAAHAAALFWGEVGNELNAARADMLLGHAHALAGSGELALAYARRSHDFLLARDSPDWEIAFAHVVLANAAAAAGDARSHARHYAEAREAGAKIADAEDREIFEKTMARVPKP